ncbi:MAG: terpene cyclase/mutase family protein [Candidatus Omnitrophica bacterium]|nr:terpene cyclase/mutase family protein [Candidatus Omnitrophota bacterium]
MFKNHLRNVCFGIILSFCFASSVLAYDPSSDIKLEADYILSCQFNNSSNDAYGAINNVFGNPTWVVPGENAVAIMGLSTASKVLNDPVYVNKANLAADYLVRVQDNDGAWFDQYDYANSVSGAGKSLRHTAEVVMAFDKLGFNAARYDSIKKASQFIIDCQNPINKGGIDDGLVGGGKEADGSYRSWRWTSDNAYAYQALKTAANWAQQSGDHADAANFNNAASRVLDGINNKLAASGNHWVRVVDSSGNVVSSEDRSDWISYAPLMLDLPVQGVNPSDAGDWIHNNLQKLDGAVVWDDASFSERKSPGYSFQAMLVWLDTAQSGYSDVALNWAENSGLWQKVVDSNGVVGGWVDWVEQGNKPDDWQRFIDTSAYYIMVKNGGYDFKPTVTPEPVSMFLFGIGGLAMAVLKIKNKKV